MIRHAPFAAIALNSRDTSRCTGVCWMRCSELDSPIVEWSMLNWDWRCVDIMSRFER